MAPLRCELVASRDGSLIVGRHKTDQVGKLEFLDTQREVSKFACTVNRKSGSRYHGGSCKLIGSRYLNDSFKVTDSRYLTGSFHITGSCHLTGSALNSASYLFTASG